MAGNIKTNRHLQSKHISRSCTKLSKSPVKTKMKSLKPATFNYKSSVKYLGDMIVPANSNIEFRHDQVERNNEDEYKQHKDQQIATRRPNKSPNFQSKHESTQNKPNLELYDQSKKTKISLVGQNSNLDDSVDFIPVKLLNKSTKFKTTNKVATDDKVSKKHRPTWDQVLKGDGINSCENKNRYYAHGSSNGRCLSPNVTCEASKKDENRYNNARSTTLRDDNLQEVSNNHFLSCLETQNNILHTNDPVKAMENLIEKLRRKILNQPQNDNLNKIILDMENALLKIPVEDDPKATPEMCSSVKSLTDNSSIKQNNSSGWDMISLKKNLEESCHFLQSLCIKQRESCSNHIREKEQLSIQLAESRRLLAIANSRETDYEKTIGELRLKLQEANIIREKQSLSIKEITGSNAKLQTENEALTSLKVCLNECSAEKDILQSKLHLKDLEIEKLKVLLKVKQNHIISPEDFKDKTLEENQEEYVNLELPLNKKSLFSFQSESSLDLSKPKIICSSQASSSPRHSPSPSNSWTHISSIPQDVTEINDLRNSLVRVFNVMKAGTEWSDSDLELEEPMMPLFSSDEDDDIRANLHFDSVAALQ